MDYIEAVKLAKEGKEEGFNFLYESTYKSKYYLALKYMQNKEAAKDVLQDAYVRAFSKLDMLDNPEAFSTWLGTIVANTAKNALQKKNPMLFSDAAVDFGNENFEYQIEDEKTQNQPEIAYTQKETQELVHELISSLSEEQRMCILMFHIEGESIREIADALECSENTVKSRLNYGRKNLKAKAEELQKKGYKLYNIAPTSLLVYLLMSEKKFMAAEGALELAGDMIVENIAHAVNASGHAGVAVGVEKIAKAGIGTAAKAAKNGFIHTVAGKITVAALGICIAGGAVGVSIWNSGEKTTEAVNEQNEEDTDQQVDTDQQGDAEEQVDTKGQVDTKENEESQEQVSQNEEDKFQFEDLKNLQFYFSSGAGRTYVNIYADGSFSGEYSDSDMGDTGEDYPNGTIHQSDFTGQFTQPVKVNEYTYSIRIRELSYAEEVGKEEIEDGVLYCYEKAYGMDGAEDFLIYLPDAPLDELPEEFKEWLIDNAVLKDTDTKIPFYALYNENKQNVFLSCSIADRLKADIESAEEKASALEESIRYDALTQMEYNQKTYQLYKLWDIELNSVWGILKQVLDAETMSTLTVEEREWIAWKEQEVNEAGAEYEGGSMQPMVMNEKAAELTKDRVYELMKLFD